MAKLSLALALVTLVAVSVATLSVSAAGPDDRRVMSFKGRPNWSWAVGASGKIELVDPNAERQAVVFSNFGSMKDLFEANVATDVAGPDSPIGQQWLAMPFTPRFDAKVRRIAVAIEHNTGSPNSFVLSLNEDGGGLIPGSAIRSWIVKRAPEFGTCCRLDIVKAKGDIKLRKGTQYWVVATTNEADESVRMEWDLSPLGIEGNFAMNTGQGWEECTAFTSAFAVYGEKID